MKNTEISARSISHFLLLLAIFLSLFSHRQMSAQDRNDFATLYTQKKISALKEYYDRNRIKEDDWRLFVRTLFVSDADSALAIYARIYGLTGDKQLRGFIRERVADLYYARGYYETSRKLLKDEKYFRKLMSANINAPLPKESFGLQTGAFGSYENALKAKNKLLKNVKDVTIIRKKSNGNDLFIVVVGRYNSRDEAEKALQEVKRNYGIKGFVIQY
ncbi:MAG: SPOR domain-containing protein [Calditrichia bacterium]